MGKLFAWKNKEPVQSNREQRQGWIGKIFVGWRILETRQRYIPGTLMIENVVTRQDSVCGTVEDVSENSIKLNGKWEPLVKDVGGLILHEII